MDNKPKRQADSHLKSNTKIIPLNGNILLKVVTRVSSIVLNKSLDKPLDFQSALFYVDGTSHDSIPINARVLLNSRIINDYELRIDYPSNTQSKAYIHNMLSTETNEVRTKYIKDNPKTVLIEYMLVAWTDIIAKIEN